MSRPTLYISRRLAEPIMAAVRAGYTLVQEPPEQAPDRNALADGLRAADAAICTLSDPLDAAMLRGITNLKVLANYAVGFNNIDLGAAAAQKIIVTNTPDVLTDSTADVAWALMLAVARRVVEGDAYARSGQWTGAGPTQMLATDVTGATLGIVGLGRIGQAVARRAAGFTMSILYHSRRALPAGSIPAAWERCSLEDLLRRSDFVSLHLPLTPDSRRLIGRDQLALMKPTAFLINTARGPIVDEAALVEALQQGRLAGAGLDVFEQEPTIHPGLLPLRNVVLLPHVGSATLATRVRMGMICLRNIEAVLSGRPAPNRVT